MIRTGENSFEFIWSQTSFFVLLATWEVASETQYVLESNGNLSHLKRRNFNRKTGCRKQRLFTEMKETRTKETAISVDVLL